MKKIDNFLNKALLVYIDNPILDSFNSKEEFQELARSANVFASDTISLSQKNKNISISLYIGQGDAKLIEKQIKH